MRAAYLEDLTIQDQYVINGETYHHLVHVVRIEKGEELLLLNGKGLEVICKVTQINKRDLFLEKKQHRQNQLNFHCDVALGLPKKDAFDLCLKQIVELGITKAYLVKSSYSQFKLPEADRMHKVLVSALEQSNSPHLTELVSCDFKDIDYAQYDQVVLLDSQTGQVKPEGKKGKSLLIVGPEGGFSPEEFSFFETLPNLVRLHLPTPIMRTPTALSCGVGVILQRLMD